jgi:hypothetical protein
VVIKSKQGDKRGDMIYSYRGYHPLQVKKHYRSLCSPDAAHHIAKYQGTKHHSVFVTEAVTRAGTGYRSEV